MQILVKQALVKIPASKHNNTVVDLLIKDGIVELIDTNIIANADMIIDEAGLICSAGWVDIFSNFCSPGLEHRETFESGSAAAIAGGFTHVFVVPNTNPTLSSQSQINYIIEKSKQLAITISPLGAISKKVEGKELAEMHEMYDAGAIAFTDGINPVQSASLLLKALQYVKPFNGIIIQMPVDDSFANLGLVNEGIISTQLGLSGIPVFAETLIVKRDIELLKYTQSKLHITGVSNIEAINLIDEAKKQGLNITCSVTPHHLLFCDEDLIDYDTNLKVSPPLRTRTEMLLLQQAVLEGKIDCIASHHFPYQPDDKVCEFEYAKNGMISLQTVFAAINTALPELATEKLLDLLSNNARKIFNLSIPAIEVGIQAELTLFSREGSFILTKENNKSKSVNSPLIGEEQKGKVIGIINKGKVLLN